MSKTYQVITTDSALAALRELIDDIKTDGDHFDKQVGILSEALEKIANGCTIAEWAEPRAIATKALKDAGI